MKKMLVRWDGLDLDAGDENTIACVLEAYGEGRTNFYLAMFGGRPLYNEDGETVYYETVLEAKQAIEVVLGISDI